MIGKLLCAAGAAGAIVGAYVLGRRERVVVCDYGFPMDQSIISGNAFINGLDGSGPRMTVHADGKVHLHDTFLTSRSYGEELLKLDWRRDPALRKIALPNSRFVL